MYSNCCCSCSFEPKIIKIGQVSHKMYHNYIVNFQESTTIVNASTKKAVAIAKSNRSWRQKARHCRDRETRAIYGPLEHLIVQKWTIILHGSWLAAGKWVKIFHDIKRLQFSIVGKTALSYDLPTGRFTEVCVIVILQVTQMFCQNLIMWCIILLSELCRWRTTLESEVLSSPDTHRMHLSGFTSRTKKTTSEPTILGLPNCPCVKVFVIEPLSTALSIFAQQMFLVVSAVVEYSSNL